MRIVAGTWRGRSLQAPAGDITRPTADRARQALFDMLLHAPWGGRVDGLCVLDAFAGTGALGLEALSRGAGRSHFLERDSQALIALQANVLACRAGERAVVRMSDVLRPPPGEPCALLLLDPPYGQDLVGRAVPALEAAGWVAPGALLVAELGAAEAPPTLREAWGMPLVERRHGAARLVVWRRS